MIRSMPNLANSVSFSGQYQAYIRRESGRAISAMTQTDHTKHLSLWKKKYDDGISNHHYFPRISLNLWLARHPNSDSESYLSCRYFLYGALLDIVKSLWNILNQQSKAWIDMEFVVWLLCNGSDGVTHLVFCDFSWKFKGVFLIVWSSSDWNFESKYPDRTEISISMWLVVVWRWFSCQKLKQWHISFSWCFLLLKI